MLSAAMPAAVQAGPARTFSIAVGIDADTLDPAGQTTTTVANMVDYMFETLVAMDWESGEVVPRLATSWEVSPDGLAYTFRLRQGVRFQDGTPFDARAVKFTFERLLNPDTRVPIRYVYAAIDSVEAVDPYTVRFRLKNPSGFLLGALTYTVAAIVSPEEVQRIGSANLRLNPGRAGTGPYRFVEWVHGDHITVERNPDYWGDKPAYDRVVFRVMPDAGAREAALLAGDVQMAVLPPAPDVPALQRNPRVQVVAAPTVREIFLALNNQRKPFDDVRVRQAVNYALDKQTLINQVLFGLASVLDAPTTPFLFGYRRQQEGGWPYDPQKARQLLAEAGYPNGFEADLLTPNGRYIQDYQFAQAIAAQLSRVGIRARVRTADWPTFVSEVVKPLDQTSIHMLVLGWATPYPDADGELYGQFHSSQWPPRGLAPSFYRNERVDALLDEARRLADQERRRALYAEAQRLIWEDAPWAWLWSQKFYVAVDAGVEGVRITPDEKWDAIYARPRR